MQLFIGLGNKAKKYEKTRHNVGFMVLDNYIKENFPEAIWKLEKKFKALVYKVGEYVFVKPQTNMNKSGESISRIVRFFDIKPSDITVIHDDVDLSFCNIRKGFANGSAGHKGVQSIIDQIGTNEFHRVRIGIGRPENPKINIEDWVLMNFKEDEMTEIYRINLSSYIG